MGKRSIDDFEVRDSLGSGAQGEVFCAYDNVLERRVALKVFKPSAEGSNAKRALREARSLARLQHPNIVTLFGITRQGESHVLIMEYSDGVPLSKRLEQGPLTFIEIENIVRQLASALQYAADCGLVHGDVKPSNILIGTDGTAKLLDFGLATITEKDDGLVTLEPCAGQASFEGTIAYTAPERIMGYPGDIRSDIFSMGAVLYEMSTGRPAFAGPSQAATLNKILSEHPAPLARQQDEIAPWCQPLIDAMLAKDPKSRLASVAQICHFLPGPDARTSTVVETRTQLMWLRQPGLSKIRQFLEHAALCLLALALSGSSSLGLPQAQTVPLREQISHGMDRLINFHEAGAIADARATFGHIVESEPEHPAGNAGLALALIREYTSQEADPATLRRATALAEQALVADPQLALANVAAAWAADFNEDYTRSQRLYDLADSLDPGGIFVLEGRARSFSMQQKFGKSEAILRRASKLYPKRRVFFDELGAVLSAQGEYSEAEQVFRKGLQLYPDNVRGYANLSHALYMQGRPKEAIRTAQLGLQIRPDASLYNNLGTYLFFEGLYEQSAAAFERTLELDGNTHELLYWANLADAYRWLPGKHDAARSAYRQAIRLLKAKQAARPDHSGINTRMALYAAKAGDFDLARANLAKLTVSELRDARDRYRITVLYEILGDRSAALQMLGSALDAGYSRWEIKNDPELTKLRQDRAYQILMGEI